MKVPPPSPMLQGRSSAPKMMVQEDATQQMPAQPASGGMDQNTQVFLAMLGDLLINKGRGADRIMAMYGADKSPLDREQQQAQIEQIRANTEKAKQRPGEKGISPLALARFELDKERFGYQQQRDKALFDWRNTQNEQAQQRWEMDNNPQHPAAERVREFLYQRGVQPGSIDGLSISQIKGLSPQVNDLAEFAMRGILAQTEAAKAGARAAAEHPYKMAQAREGAVARIQGEQDVYSAPMPGLVTTDEAAWKRAMGDDVQRRKVYTMAESYSVINEGMNDMAELRRRYGAQIPGEVQAEFDAAKTFVVGGITQLGNTGVLNEGEWARFNTMLPGLLPSWKDVLSGALNTFSPDPQRMRDITYEQLQGVQRALTSAMNRKLRASGAQIDDGENLGVTNNVPPLPRDARKPRKRPEIPARFNGLDLTPVD